MQMSFSSLSHLDSLVWVKSLDLNRMCHILPCLHWRGCIFLTALWTGISGNAKPILYHITIKAISVASWYKCGTTLTLPRFLVLFKPFAFMNMHSFEVSYIVPFMFSCFPTSSVTQALLTTPTPFNVALIKETPVGTDSGFPMTLVLVLFIRS